VHCIPKINFSENKFKDNAIMHARIEIDIKNYREQPQNSSLPKFIFDKEIDRHNISVNETQAELNRVFEFTQVPNQAD
jgi:late competence protein required for DNA uptake (superfamily II DNA/RNA helicase)